MSLEAEVQDAVSGMGMVAARGQAPHAQHGMIVNGSFDPKLGTVKVLFGSDMIQYDASGNLIPVDQLPARGPYPLLVPWLGVQGAPVGGERCVVIPAAGTWVVAMTHWDDSPGIEAGEFIAQSMRFPDSHLHLKNDGTSVHKGQTAAIVTGPQVYLGEMTSQGADGVVRQSDLQLAINALQQAVQTALNTLAQTVQPGGGVPAPDVADTTVQASTITHSG